MYIGRDFSPGEDGETRVRGYDLFETLGPGETILSVASGLVCVDGEDGALADDPKAHFIGDAEFSGTSVIQSVSFYDPLGQLSGNVYSLILAALTSFGQIIAPWSRIPLGTGFGTPSVPTAVSPSSARAIVLPTPGPKFTLPTNGGFALQDFPTCQMGEARLYGFDFASALSPGELILSGNFILVRLAGIDPTIDGNGQAYNAGPPVIMGSQIQQVIDWPSRLPDLTGNVYALAATILTTFNQQVPAWARANVNGPAPIFITPSGSPRPPFPTSPPASGTGLAGGGVLLTGGGVVLPV